MSNNQYNQEHSSLNNMNAIKAKLHNQVILKLTENNNYDKVVIDQFTSPKSYFNYLKMEPKVFKNIIFVTKGEDKSYAVAVGSIISRYIFLKEYLKIETELKRPLPKGAGSEVDKIGLDIVNEHGLDKLTEIAKISFKNTEKIKDRL